MFDPVELLIACSFAAVFIFGLGIDIGLKIGAVLERRRQPQQPGGIALFGNNAPVQK